MSRDDVINRMLDIYEQPLLNGLTELSDMALQPPDIKINLKPHQLAMIYAMNKKERDAVEGFTINQEIHYSQFAILGDKVGSGKTLMLLGHLSNTKTMIPTNTFSRIHEFSKTKFWSKKPIYTTECSGNTLIIVPHTLFHQWKYAIQQQTTLSFLEVKTIKAFEKHDFLENIRQRDITLMSNTIIKTFMSEETRHKIQWARIIFDEVDSIQFTSTVPMPNAKFYWLITATWTNILFHGLYIYITENYLNRRIAAGMNPELISMLQNDQVTNSNNYYSRYEIHSGNFFSPFLSKHPNRGHLILRTNTAFMEKSWKSPPIIELRIECEAPIQHRLVSQFVNSEIQELLHAGNIEGALEKLGVSNSNQSSLISALNNTREKELDRLEKTLAFKETLDYTNVQSKEQAISSLKTKIESIKEQIHSLKQRILHFKDEICAICFEEPSVPTLVTCCSRLFCGECIINCYKREMKCPLCRATIGILNMKQLNIESDKINQNTIITPMKPSKKDALIKLISETRSGKFLIFNRYDNPFLEIEGQLLEKDIRVANLRGNKDHISSILKQFEKGDIRVLLMNSMETGAGIDLKSSTHIVLMHNMRKEEEQQIIGRAIRLGRTEPLHLIRLLHEAELV
jgi:superfamily II DNA or RNA helicase